METNPMNISRDKTPEEIEAEMQQTRNDLSEKVIALEQQVLGTAQMAADSLNTTITQGKTLLEQAPRTARESAREVVDAVREAFDVSGQVQSRPWTSIGIAAGVGLLAGLMLPRKSQASAPAPVVLPVSPLTAPPSIAPTPTVPAAPPPPATPTIFDELVVILGRKLREVAETAIDSATTAAKTTVREEAPKLLQTVTERLTEKPRSVETTRIMNGIHFTACDERC